MKYQKNAQIACLLKHIFKCSIGSQPVELDIPSKCVMLNAAKNLIIKTLCTTHNLLIDLIVTSFITLTTFNTLTTFKKMLYYDTNG